MDSHLLDSHLLAAERLVVFGLVEWLVDASKKSFQMPLPSNRFDRPWEMLLSSIRQEESRMDDFLADPGVVEVQRSPRAAEVQRIQWSVRKRKA